MTTSYVVKVALHSGGVTDIPTRASDILQSTNTKVKEMLKKGKKKKKETEKVKAETMRLAPMLPTVQSGVHISALMVLG